MTQSLIEPVTHSYSYNHSFSLPPPPPYPSPPLSSSTSTSLLLHAPTFNSNRLWKLISSPSLPRLPPTRHHFPYKIPVLSSSCPLMGSPLTEPQPSLFFPWHRTRDRGGGMWFRRPHGGLSLRVLVGTNGAETHPPSAETEQSPQKKIICV